MTPRFPDRNVDSISRLLQVIADDEKALSAEPSAEAQRRLPRVWYRGLTNHDYKLVPTLHTRGIPVGRETNLMNRFKQNAYQFLQYRPQGEWEWMFLARHHGLPSRLMDWTESPLVGIYFSLFEEPPKEEADPESDGALWCLLPETLNALFSRKAIGPGVIPMFSVGEQGSRDDQFLDNYLPSRIQGSATEASIPPMGGMGIRTTVRIQAQQGVFTIHHADKTPLEDWGDGSHVWRYIVPGWSKREIREQLRRLQVNRLTVFPELDNVAWEAPRGL